MSRRDAAGPPPGSTTAAERARVAEHGFAVRLVGGRDRAGDVGAVACTVGLTSKGHPELVCDGLPEPSSSVLLQHLGHRVVDEQLVLRHGQHLDVGEPLGRDAFVAVIEVEDGDDLSTTTQTDGDGGRVLQVVWTDSTGRFPWHAGYANPSTAQRLRGPVPVELLSLPCPDAPPLPAAAGTEELVVTTQAVLDGAAVTAVWHEADGGWQLLDGDVTDESVPVGAHRQHLVDADPTLAAALRIPAGSRATRGGAGEDWVQWPLGSA